MSDVAKDKMDFSDLIIPEQEEMKVITIPQPWAWAVFNDGLNILNASTAVTGDFDGVLVIQSAPKERFDDMYVIHPAVKDINNYPAPDEYEYGKVLGTVRIAFCGEAMPGTEPGEWANPDAEYWIGLDKPRALKTAIEFDDGQTSGVRDISEEFANELHDALYPILMAPQSIKVHEAFSVVVSGEPTEFDIAALAKELTAGLTKLNIPFTEDEIDKITKELEGEVDAITKNFHAKVELYKEMKAKGLLSDKKIETKTF
jgi:hypothetical protein